MEIPEPSPFSQNGSTTSDLPGTNDQSAENEQEEDDIAFAAEAAANAVEEADAEQQRLDQALLRCRVCGGGVSEGRPLLRFLPMNPALAGLTTQSLPRNMLPVPTFGEDICLHVFCGKTASILPTVNQPELEILTKAGLKNKHGIGAEVNAALARTRCAFLVSEGTTVDTSIGIDSPGTFARTMTTGRAMNKQEKPYFLVREFEAHLAAVRSSNVAFNNEVLVAHCTMHSPSSSQNNDTHPPTNTHVGSTLYTSEARGTTHPQISQGNAATTSIASAYPSASNSTPTSTGPASPMLRLLTPPGGRLMQSLTPIQPPNEALSPSQTVCVNLGSTSHGLVLPPQDMTSNGGLPLLTLQSSPYPNTTAVTTFLQTTDHHSLISQNPAAPMFTSPTNNNMMGQLGQAPIPPQSGPVLLPPPLPQGQDVPLNRMMSPNAHSNALLTNSSIADIGGFVGYSELPHTTYQGSKGSPPKKAGAGKTGTKLTRMNEPHGALLVAPTLADPGIVGRDGKVKCECGGTYFNAISSSWRDHVITKRHQRWIESRGIQRQHANY